MKLFLDYLIVLLVGFCFFLFALFLYFNIKNRCQTLVDRWISGNGIRPDLDGILLKMFDYPLQAVVTGLDTEGRRKIFTLALGGTVRGQLLDQAKLLNVESLD